MVEIADIKDRKSFEAWLKQEDLPREKIVWLASRSALRVLPLAWEAAVRNTGNLTPHPFLRANLVAMVAAASPSNSIQSAADYAANYVYAFSAADAANCAAEAAFDELDRAVSATAEAAEHASASAIALNFDPWIWETCRDDARLAAEIDNLSGLNGVLSLWRNYLGPPLAAEWSDLKLNLEQSELDWSFWIDWYQRHLDGRPHDLALLQRIALSDLDPNRDHEPEDFDPFWQGTDAEVLARINAIVADHGRDGGTPLSNASPVDFELNASGQWLEMVARAKDIAYIRDAAKVQSFLDAAERVEDSFEGLLDYEGDLRGRGNRAASIVTSAERIIKEFRRTKDRTELRSGDVLELSGDFLGFSEEAKEEGQLGETLTRIVDRTSERLREFCFEFFAPLIADTAVLRDLELEGHDPSEIIEVLRATLSALRDGSASGGVLPLSREALAVLELRLRDLEALAERYAESDSDAYREQTGKKVAEKSGTYGAVVGQAVKRSRELGTNLGANVGLRIDELLKQFKRVKGLSDVLDFLQNLLGGGGGGP